MEASMPLTQGIDGCGHNVGAWVASDIARGKFANFRGVLSGGAGEPPRPANPDSFYEPVQGTGQASTRDCRPGL